MLNSETFDRPNDDPGAAPPVIRDRATTIGRAPRRDARTHPAHERAALAGAVDGGLMPDEVAQILAGRRLMDAFPVRWDESPEAYAARAVSEMFVAYLQ